MWKPLSFFRGWDTLRLLGSMIAWAQRNQTRQKSDHVKLVMHEDRGGKKFRSWSTPDLALPLTLECTPANFIRFHFLKNGTEYVPVIQSLDLFWKVN